MAPNCSKLLQIATKGSKLVQMGLNWSNLFLFSTKKNPQKLEGGLKQTNKQEVRLG